MHRGGEAWYIPMPPGDDDYVPGGGQRGRRPETRAEPPRINLTPFWTKDTRSWFMLTESTFNRYGVHNSRLMFDLLLPALPDEAFEQVRAILHSVSETSVPFQHAEREASGDLHIQRPGHGV